MRAHRDLVAAAAAAVLLTVLLLSVQLEGVRLAAALPLSLVLPGYAITAAAFAPRPLPRPQLLLLSLGMSLATLAIGALVLNYIPGGLRAAPWAVLLLLVVLAGSGIAAIRRPGTARAGLPRLRPRLRVADGALLAAAALAVAAAAVIWSRPLPAKNAVGYTRLSMLPSASAKVAAVRIGVVSQEQDPVAYRLEVQSGRRRTPGFSQFVLRPGHGRGFEVRANRSTTAGPVPVTALLFRQDRPNVVYRRVAGWIPARATR